MGKLWAMITKKDGGNHWKTTQNASK